MTFVLDEPASVLDSSGLLNVKNDASKCSLETLWCVAFPEIPFDVDSPEWLRLGFQTNPNKDLRSAGTVGLRQCLQFCQSSGACPLHLVLTSQSTFPLAIASLNVSLLVMQFFGLCSKSGGAGSLQLCSDEIMRSAVRLQLSLPGTSLVDIIHDHLTRWLFDRYHESEASASSRHPTMLFEFPTLLRATGGHLQHSLAQLPQAWTLSSLLLSLRSSSTSVDSETAVCDCGGKSHSRAAREKARCKRL